MYAVPIWHTPAIHAHPRASHPHIPLIWLHSRQGTHPPKIWTSKSEAPAVDPPWFVPSISLVVSAVLTCTLHAQTSQWDQAEQADAAFELEMDRHAESMLDERRAVRAHLPSMVIEPEIMLVPEVDAEPMSDAEITKCMKPITCLAQFNPANHCAISIRANNLRSGAEAVLALLEYAHSPPGSRFACPADVAVGGHLNMQPICFLDIRTDFQM